MQRRNLVPGPSPTWSTAGLSTTGLPAPIERMPDQLRPEFRPRLYEVNDGRGPGGSLGLGLGPAGPISADYTRPGDAPAPAPSPAAEECSDCG